MQGALRRRCSVSTNRHRRSKAQPLNRLTQRNGVCPSGETIGRARLNPFGLTPGRLFGERGSILCSRSRIRGTGILQVSRHETLEKPETASIIARTTERMEDFGGGCGPTQRTSLAPIVLPFRRERPRAQFRHRPPVQHPTVPRHRPLSNFAGNFLISLPEAADICRHCERPGLRFDP